MNLIDKYLGEKKLPPHIKDLMKKADKAEKAKKKKFGFSVKDRTPKGYGPNEGYRGSKKGKAAKRTKFNADVQAMVYKLGGHGGKVDWDTVSHLFNTGKDVEYTAKRIVDIQKGK